MEKVLRRFNMQKIKSMSTLFFIHLKLSLKNLSGTKAEKADISLVPYSSAVGSLMFAMAFARSDIAHEVEVVSRYMANPDHGHWSAMKWILRYLRGTSNQALCYGTMSLNCIGYVDADFAGNRDR